AALTGHLVLSTLHTNDAPAAIPRLREIGIPAYLINATVLGVMAQRLVRTLCPHCKAPTEINESAWNALTRPYKIRGQGHFFKALGCAKCRDTGFLGRVGIYEIMEMTPRLRSEIRPDSDGEEIRKHAVKDGMTQLRIAGARQVALGLTTVEEVLKVVPPDNEL
ncbi:MAG: Flp pilus assembly complex ATPase component TadA, partial [Pseudomonadota bacterium]